MTRTLIMMWTKCYSKHWRVNQMEVDANLYEFLRANETGITKDDYGLVFYVHVPFYQLDEFVEVIGEHHFEEGGMNVLMFDDTLCIDLNDIIEGAGHKITSYKKCFEDVLRPYEEEYKELDSESNE